MTTPPSTSLKTLTGQSVNVREEKRTVNNFIIRKTMNLLNYFFIVLLGIGLLLSARGEMLFYNDTRIWNESLEIQKYLKWECETEDDAVLTMADSQDEEEKKDIMKDVNSVRHAVKTYVQQILDRGLTYAIKLAKKRRAGALLDSSIHILWVNPKNDVTDEILKTLNDEYLMQDVFYNDDYFIAKISKHND